MYKNLIAVFTLSLLVFIQSCSKDPVLEMKTAGKGQHRLAGGYVPRGCIVDNKAGIKCQSAASKGCKEPSSCQAIGGAAVSMDELPLSNEKAIQIAAQETEKWVANGMIDGDYSSDFHDFVFNLLIGKETFEKEEE
ncbi:MAG: hypothetical protein U0T73_05650 [Chitinophagales bacterium]